MDVHPTKHGIFIGIDPYPNMKLVSRSMPSISTSPTVYPHANFHPYFQVVFPMGLFSQSPVESSVPSGK